MSAVRSSPSESAQLTSGGKSSSDSANTSVTEPRHSSRCGICSHPQRRTIEDAFLHKTMSVSDIRKKFGVGHDAVYRHARALNLLPTRNRNWRGTVEPDNSAEVSTEVPESEKSVVHVEVAATVYARAMVELLLLEANDDLLSAIEEAIEVKAQQSGLPIDLAANQVHIAAALTKIRCTPDSWPTWFRSKGYENQG